MLGSIRDNNNDFDLLFGFYLIYNFGAKLFK